MKRENYAKRIGFITCYIFIIFFAASCAARYNRYGLPQYDYEYQVPQQLDDGWQTSTLDAEGVDSAKINEMMGNILDGDIDNIHGIVVIKMESWFSRNILTGLTGKPIIVFFRPVKVSLQF
ncbi:hypothetical protein D1BOALGB6SA_7928 [Olavius sp. associated proteobacterium Delta 1]|nr:hypothetical protein D1BOALGB6SA_7928 [Olavius sp. associated proteobacterium Delta 1]